MLPPAVRPLVDKRPRADVVYPSPCVHLPLASLTSCPFACVNAALSPLLATDCALVELRNSFFLVRLLGIFVLFLLKINLFFDFSCTIKKKVLPLHCIT